MEAAMKKAIACWTIALGLISGVAVARAGVTLESYVKTSGVAGMMGHELNRTSYYEGPKLREDRRMKFTGSVLGAMQRMAGVKGVETEIVRYDLKKRWEVSEDGRVEEMPLLGKEDARRLRKQASGEKHGGGKHVENLKIEVKAIDSRTIAGWKAKGHELTARYLVVDKNTGEKVRGKLIVRRWTAQDRALRQAWREISDFHARHEGLREEEMQIMYLGASVLGALSMNEKQLRRLGKALADMGGFPLATESESWIENSGRKKQSPAGGEGLEGAVAGLLGGLLSSAADDVEQRDGMSKLADWKEEFTRVTVGDVPDALFEKPASQRREGGG
ncbi:MAG: hypothetical protein R8K47_08415, partial [Mariprofundaceae bacterium]